LSTDSVWNLNNNDAGAASATACATSIVWRVYTATTTTTASIGRSSNTVA
jgi:hypothetical protein